MDQTLLKTLFNYDPYTGIFKRINRLKCNGELSPCDFVGKAKSTYGYLQYTIKGKTYDVHRLIFMYMDGSFAETDIDHIDGDRLNNKWNNLRKVSRETNLRNVGKRKTSHKGVTGVGLQKSSKKWKVWIGKKYQKCGFNTFEEALHHRKTMEKELGYTEGHFVREVWDGNKNKS